MPSVVCPIASGSLGNALLVRTDRAAVLVDFGTTQKRVKAGLAHAGLGPEDLGAVLLTHTHRDHFSQAAAGFCVRYGVPVHSTNDNFAELTLRVPGFRKLMAVGLARPVNGEPVAVGDLVAEAFDLPHDAPGRCLGFRFTLGSGAWRRVATVATDLGHVPHGGLEWFTGADCLVLESNHDPEMLSRSGRPWDLIDRIAGPHGHLSNAAAAEAVAAVSGRGRPGRLKHVILAHLSRDCNTPRLAIEAQARLASCRAGAVDFSAADQFAPGPVVVL